MIDLNNSSKLKMIEKLKKSKAFPMWTCLVFLLVTYFYLSLNHFQTPCNHQKAPWKDIRLPKFIQATEYKLDFKTNLNQSTFGGLVEIGLKTTEKTDFIVIHNVNLNLKFKGLSGDHKHSHDLRSIKYYPKLQYSILTFTKPLSNGHYVLTLAYHGHLNTDLSGYYISTYYDSADQPHNIATTQFEPTDARKAFPCLDEPFQKATFDISMNVEHKYHALSNMPVKSMERVDDTWVKYSFEKTVKMSTYLLAFITSDFEKISARTSNNVTVSVWTVPGKSDLGTYALKVGVPILEFYQTRFGIEYPLPKLDMIAIPDFAAGVKLGLM